MQKNILVTGGAGFIGASVCRQLIDNDFCPIVFDSFQQYSVPLNSAYNQFLNYRFNGISDRIVFERGDTRHISQLRNVFRKYEPLHVIHLANLPIADLAFSNSEEAIGTILTGSVNLLECLSEFSCAERLVYISSSFVYGDFEFTPASEVHPTRPKDIYGGAKLAAEILIQSYSKRGTFKYTILRPSAVYGPTDVNRRVVQIFLENALQGKPLIVEGGSSTSLDFTYVEDVAQGIVQTLSADRAENQIFNLTRGEGRSLLDLVDIFRTYFPDLEIELRPESSFRPKRGTLAIEKAKACFGFSPVYSLEAGMDRYINFYRNLRTPLPIPDKEGKNTGFKKIQSKGKQKTWPPTQTI